MDIKVYGNCWMNEIIIYLKAEDLKDKLYTLTKYNNCRAAKKRLIA